MDYGYTGRKKLEGQKERFPEKCESDKGVCVRTNMEVINIFSKPTETNKIRAHRLRMLRQLCRMTEPGKESPTLKTKCENTKARPRKKCLESTSGT